LTTGSCSDAGYTKEVGTKSVTLPNLGDISLGLWSNISEEVEKGQQVSIYRSELFVCLEGDCPAEICDKIMSAIHFSEGKCSDQGYTKEIGAKTIDVPVIGDFAVEIYRKALDASASVSLYRTELFACIEGEAPALVAGEIKKFLHMSEGKCADEGYTKEIGAKTIDVPVVGDFAVEIYRKALEAPTKGQQVSIYRSELFVCLEGDCPAEICDKIMSAIHFSEGKCSDQGYTK